MNAPTHAHSNGCCTTAVYGIAFHVVSTPQINMTTRENQERGARERERGKKWNESTRNGLK